MAGKHLDIPEKGKLSWKHSKTIFSTVFHPCDPQALHEHKLPSQKKTQKEPKEVIQATEKRDLLPAKGEYARMKQLH